jgi:hypothetical protein
MRTLGMTYTELLEAMRACIVLYPSDTFLEELQELLVRFLAEREPELAERVRDLDGDQMHELCEFIRRAHVLTSDKIARRESWTRGRTRVPGD